MSVSKHQKLNTNTTHSNIFSDYSKAMHREQGFQRKLKHLTTENNQLQQKIKVQAEQIKDQRKAIIYQMNQLSVLFFVYYAQKSISAKLSVYQDKKLTMDMVEKQEDAHQLMQELIHKYQQIEKQQKMVINTKQNMQKMMGAYTNHGEVLEKIVKEASQSNLNSEMKVNSEIQQKRAQIAKKIQNNSLKREKIKKMRQLMCKFEAQKPSLAEKQIKLKENVKNIEAILKQKTNQCKQMESWAEIVIDKKKRAQLFQKLSQKNKQLCAISQTDLNIQIKLNCEKFQ